MGMAFVPTWLRQVSPLLHKTTLITGTVELWNSLPDNLCHLDLSLGQFRRALKTHLF